MTSPSHSRFSEAEELQIEHPNSIQDDDSQNQPKQHSQPQSPQTQTLETSDLQNHEQPEVNHGENQREDEPEDVQVIDQDGVENHNQEPGDRPELSGVSTLSPPRLSLVEPLADPHDPDPAPPLTSPANPPRRPIKRKKGTNKKRQQAIEKKLQALYQSLKPIPFVPCKTLDFDKHENVLKRLGLWDFVHIEFDRNIRVDLIAQLIVNYDSKLRCSYVSDFRIGVNRADLARALKLPVKKDKVSLSALSSEAVDLDSEVFPEESIAFTEDLVSNWVLLHEDTWMMPGEVLNWTRVIKDRHPEKVDWAGLIWFMVEKELMQGPKLEDCYYASHLQYLIKSQREDLFVEERKVEVVMEVKEEEDGGDVNLGRADDFQGQESHDNDVVEGPNVELTLGQENVEQEEVKDEDNVMDIEESKEEQGHWLLDGKNSIGDHFLQRCNMDVDVGLDDGEDERKMVEEEEEDNDEEEEEEADDEGFNLTPPGHTLVSDGLTGNLIHGMETEQIPFSLAGQLHDQSNMDLLASRTATHTSFGGPSNLGNGSKREIDHDHDLSHDSLNVNNKRLRIDGPWGNKSSDFDMCMEQVQHLMGKARMMYEEKEHACAESNMNQQFLLGEVQRQEQLLGHLEKTKYEELQRKDGEIYRLERELFIMGNVLESYRKALKETQKAFSEYRQQVQLPEEPLYKDAGPGGVVLSTTELEKLRLKKEHEDRLVRIMLEQKMKAFEEDIVGKFEGHFIEVQKLDERLLGLENEVKLLKESSAKRKVSETSEIASNE